MMKEREEKDKSRLTIRLAEPVIYLKDVDFSGRHRTHNELSPPSMVRGILVLHLSKPTKISSIGIELTAKSSTRHPEGVGNRRIEVTEENQLYSSSTVYFRQESGGHHRSTRRAVSLGPTLSMDDGSSTGSGTDLDIDHEDGDVPHVRRTRDPIRGRRGASVDLTNFQRDVVSHHAPTRVPTPAYMPTAEDTPEASPASSAVNLPATQHTPPPPDQGSHPSTSHVRSNSSPVQRDPRTLTVSGTGNDFDPNPPLSRRRASQALEDFWRALKPDPNNTPSPSRSTPPPRIDATTLAPPILGPSLTNTPSRLSPSGSPDGFDDDTQARRKSRNRFSFFALSDAIRDSVRPGSSLSVKKKVEGTPVRSDSHDNDRNGESVRGRSREKGKGKSRDLSTALIKVSEVFGLEPEEGRESRDGWQEFKKGTYTYPISFTIPADSPPTLDCMYGSISWSMKATVHRPGKFTPRMETVRTVNVVATPSEDATEDVESVTVNKTWEDQMVYYLSIVGRAFPIGSKIPIQLTFMPLAKIKIHRVSVVIDEKVTYFSRTQKAAMGPSATRQVLRCLKYSGGGHIPILPLTEDDSRRSPLYSLAREDPEYTGQSEEQRASELAAEWMGPGPWPLRFNVEVASAYNMLRPTTMNKKGNITVSHVLKVIIRVEKEDTGDVEGLRKKKVYDIVVQYPVHILSYLCNQKYTSLPPYSPTWHHVPTAPGQSSSSTPDPSNIVHEVSAIELEPPAPVYPAGQTPRATSREGEQLARQFERLVSGQETETGESPPSYKAVVSPVHVNHSQTLRA